MPFTTQATRKPRIAMSPVGLFREPRVEVVFLTSLWKRREDKSSKALTRARLLSIAVDGHHLQCQGKPCILAKRIECQFEYSEIRCIEALHKGLLF